MSRIDDLIKQYAPGGVEYKTLGELLDYEQPGKYLVTSTAYDKSFETPVLTAGQTFVLGYTDESEGVYLASSESPVVIFDDFTTAFKWVDFRFKAKSSAMKMLTPKPGIFLRYVWYAMQTIRYQPQDHARQWIGTYSTFRVPVPPHQVQREIVRILDAFTALEAQLQRELQSELEYRRAQHAHYRAELLGSRGGVSDAALDDLVEFTNGKAHERFVVPGGSVALLTARFISTSGKQVRWVDPENALSPVSIGDIAMVMSDLPNGRALARCFHVDANGKYTANQRVCRLRVHNRDLLSPRWLYHFLDRNPQLLAYDNAQDQTHLKKGQILGIRVPILPLADQERIVARLDVLYQTNRELASALDAERVARTQQYAYYRDRLLTFEEAAA